MANWVEPKSNYVATDQVTPDIFNTLAENEKFLYEIRCPMEVQDSTGNITKINSLVFVETTTSGIYKAKYKKLDGTLVEIPLESAQAVKLRNARSIGIQGLTSESASFNGTSAVKIKVTGVPAELLSGTGAIDITGNAATATEANHATNADNAEHANKSDVATITQQNLNTLESQLRSGGTIVGHAEEADYAELAGSATSAKSSTYSMEAQSAETANHATSADSATTATLLTNEWTACTPGTTYLPYGTYMFLTIIDDQASKVGGHVASFTDIITVNSNVYKGINPDTNYHNDYASGPIHIYDANSHEAPWFRTARLKIFTISSTQFRIDLYVSSSGGYASTGSDIDGTKFYPNTLARSISGITYNMYYKKIM